MNSFPLIRKSGSNETVMSYLFAVSLLYLIPEWISKPEKIYQFLLVLVTGLILDSVFNYLRYKRPVCSVSAAVTASLLQILTPEIPLWGELCALTIALILAKHLWGGTGKNVFNPAVLGFFFLVYFFKIDFPLFPFSFWIISGMVLSLPFLFFRPNASLGWMGGMITALVMFGNLSFETVVTYGVIFWGTLIITDPVTATSRPVAGFVSGFLLGFLPFLFSSKLLFLTAGILAFNLISFIIHRIPGFPDLHLPLKLNIKPPVPWNANQCEIIDLTKDMVEEKPESIKPLNSSNILSLIRENEVFGCGGGGFSTYVKIDSVLKSDVSEKFLIINGVECDPGLIHDKILLHKFPVAIFECATLISDIIPFNKIVLAVKRGFSNINTPQNIQLFQVPTYYPAGFERELIRQILDRLLPIGAIPAKQGILVLNVQTVISIATAVIENRSVKTRVITVANLQTKQTRAVRVNLGDRVFDVIQKVYSGGYPVFYGGGIMLSRQADDDSVIDKNTTFIAVSDFVHYKESPQCSHCGVCVRCCPEKLDIKRIADLFDSGKTVSSNRFHPERCISCGICSYICPAGRNLMKKVRGAADVSGTD